MPDQDAVLAITSGLGEMQPPLDLVWQHLLPAMSAAPLPADDSAQTALADKLASLQLPLPTGEASSPTAARVTGTTYTAKLWFYEAPGALTLTCRFAGDSVVVDQQANVGFGPTEGRRLEGRLA